MKNIVWVAIILLTGCASPHHFSRINVADNKPIWTDDTYANLHKGADLIDVSYGDDYEEEGREKKVLADFNKLGLNATYYSGKRLFLPRYPELYILSKEKTNALTILFVGTNGIGDWVQNAKSTNYEDCKLDDYHYIPAGHAGFRRGILILIQENFIANILAKHIERHNVRVGKNKIKISLIGHSQGAGLSQIFAPVIDGYKYKGGIRVKDNEWPYILDKIYAYGTPYAISTEGGDWKFMNEEYGDKTFMILKDADLVAAIYNAYTEDRIVPARHFGRYIRITRDNEVMEEKTKWGEDLIYKDQPHYIKNYKSALKKRISSSK